MSISQITRRTLVIGRSGVVETYNSHIDGISVSTEASGKFSITLPAEESMGAARPQQAWHSVIDNVDDLSHFNLIDVYVNADGFVKADWTLSANTGLVRIAIYTAF